MKTTLPLAAVLALAALTPSVSAHEGGDVLLQTQAGAIIVGAVNDETFESTLDVKVFEGELLTNFRSDEPGFLSFAHGNPNLPSGVATFPALHNVSFDLLPMTVGQTSSNLLYWNGADAANDGLTDADISFARPSGTVWRVLDGTNNWITADGSEVVVPGGLIQRTSSDIDPFDGVDSGAMHKHLVLELADTDENAATNPAEGIYMTAWQIRAEGFTTSEAILMVHATSQADPEAHELAVEWAEANYDALTAPPLAGDFDGSGQVDGNDFLAWQRNLGTPTAADLSPWRNAMAAGNATVAAAVVPEPTTAMIAVATSVFAAFVSRYRNR